MRPLDIALVGGCHRDVMCRTDGPFLPGTSCPGRVADTAGGVARNVAVLLASAGLGVAIAGRVGCDAAGDGLLAGLGAAGVDTSAMTREAGAATGCYVAVHDRDGELVAAVSDLAIYDAITPAALAPVLPLLDGAALLFADANLPARTLGALAERFGARMAVDAISRAKAGRTLQAMRSGALGFVNLPSAATLAGRRVADAADAAAALAGLGVVRAVVTAGPGRVAILDGGRVATVAVPEVAVADVTGAGDALTAGTLLGLRAGLPLPAAVGAGIAAAGAALAATGALDRLPPSVLERIRPSTGARP